MMDRFTVAAWLGLCAWIFGMVQPCAAQRSPGRHETPLEQVPASPAPSIQALAVGKDQAVYAGSFGQGVFRSQDRGKSWAPANEGLRDQYILSLAVAEDGTVYVGTLRGGLFKSVNGGKSWQAVNDGLKRLEVKALLPDRRVLYAGTSDGVYRLGEGEGQWTRVTKGLDDLLIHTLVFGADRTLYAGTSGKGVVRLKFNGSEWTRLSKGLKDHEGLVENFIRVLVLDREQALYAGTFDGGVFRSADGGETWLPISRSLPNDSIRGIVVNEKGLFVATGRGIFKSVTQGQKWLPVNKGLTELSVQALVAPGGGVLYAGTSAGMFRSDDDGESWAGISEGLIGTQGSAGTSPWDHLGRSGKP
ncbi:MAG: hypothetical protein ACKOCD_09930 [Nitrospiraceae bacterium]